MPSVGTSGENEWPAPTARTVPLAEAMSSCNSATFAGALRAVGTHCCDPDQLRQGMARGFAFSAAASALRGTA